jgi:hypothetical protein
VKEIIIHQIVFGRFDGYEPKYSRTESNVSAYLRCLAAACMEVADNPSQTMLETFCGISQLVDRTIRELEREEAKS